MVWKFCEIWKFYGKWLPDVLNSVRFYLKVWDMACTLFGYWKKRFEGFKTKFLKLRLLFMPQATWKGARGGFEQPLLVQIFRNYSFSPESRHICPFISTSISIIFFLTRFLSPRIRHLSPLTSPPPPHLPFHNTWKLHTFFWWQCLGVRYRISRLRV